MGVKRTLVAGVLLLLGVLLLWRTRALLTLAIAVILGAQLFMCCGNDADHIQLNDTFKHSVRCTIIDILLARPSLLQSWELAPLLADNTCQVQGENEYMMGGPKTQSMLHQAVQESQHFFKAGS